MNHAHQMSPTEEKPSILFVCVKNGGKSGDGCRPDARPRRRQGARELCRHATRHRPQRPLREHAARGGRRRLATGPKPVTPDLVAAADVVVTLGRDANVDPVEGTRVENWDTDEPSERGIDGAERMRLVRDDIRGLMIRDSGCWYPAKVCNDTTPSSLPRRSPVEGARASSRRRRIQYSPSSCTVMFGSAPRKPNGRLWASRSCSASSASRRPGRRALTRRRRPSRSRTHTAASHCSEEPLVTGRTQLAPTSPTRVRLLNSVTSLSSTTIPARVASEAGTMSRSRPAGQSLRTGEPLVTHW